MKKLIIAILTLISINSLAQFPVTQSMGTANTKVVSNGALQAVRGVINGVFTDTAAANSDQIDFYNGAQIWTRSDRNFWLRDSVLNMWVRMAKLSDASSTNIYNSNGILTGNRTLTGLNNTYNLAFDSLNSFRLQRNGITRFNMTSSITQMISPNQSGDVGTNNGNAWIIFGDNAVRNLGDSSTSTKIISYETNINGSLTTNALTTKSYVDSLVAAGGGGSGTINSGTTGKPAYYVGATTLDDFVAIDYATSGTNMLLKTQNTTDVGLDIKAQSSQTANIQNWSSSSGTGDLASLTSAGYLQAVRGGFGAAPSSHVLYATGTGSSDNLARFESTTGNAILNLKAAGEAWLKLTSSATSWYVISGNRSGGSGIDFSVTDNGGTDYLAVDGDNHTLRMVETTSGTPASGFATIYPKSDGLWYGKDDAGVETKLSNDAGGTPTLQQVFNTEVGGSDLTKIDTIDVGAYTLTMLKAATGYPLTIKNSTTFGSGIDISVVDNGIGILTTTGFPIDAAMNPSTTNTDEVMIHLNRRTTGTSAINMSSSIRFDMEQNAGSNVEVGRFGYRFTDPSSSSPASQYYVTDVIKGNADTLMALGDYVTLTESSATKFTSTTIATGKVQGGSILVTIEAKDATDFQSRTLRFIWSAVNKAGTLTITISTPEEVVAVSAGTLTCTITGVDSGSGVLSFQANAVSSLTQTTLRATYQTFKNF